jgi:hypothetical protein
MNKLLFISLFIFYGFFALPLFAQDPGEVDTVRLTNISGEIGTRVSFPVFLYNDEELSSVVMPLKVNGYSGWLRFDSVSYEGSRLLDPAILDQREAYVFDTDTFTFDNLLLSFSVSSGNNLPAGTGKLFDLWFTLHFGGGVLVDSLSDSPQGRLLLTDSNQQAFTPRFLSGLIDIACNYLVGDVNQDGNISTSDVVSLDNIWEYDYPLNSYPIYDRYGRADLKCDRRLDLRDITYLCGYLFRGFPQPCTCGTTNPSYYNDPALPDTVWVENKTLRAGIPSPICMGVINDELLSGLELKFEIEGNAGLEWDADSGVVPTNRLKAFTRWGGGEHADSINPESFNLFAWGYLVNFTPGREAVCRPVFTPKSAGTAAFHLIRWVNGSESMLVTEDNAAILPAFSGGNITVLPDPNGDEVFSVADVVYLINYLFKDGPGFDPLESGDLNCDSKVSISDVVYLINYLLKGGPPPGC